MKTKYLILAGALALVLVPFVAKAANVTLSQDVTLTLPSDGSTYILTSDSKFSTTTINSTSFDFVMSGGDRVVIRSLTKANLANSLKVNTICGTSESTVILELSIEAAGQTVTVTPGAICGGGGGGGGGIVSSGGGGYSSPTQIAAGAGAVSRVNTVEGLQAKIAALAYQLALLRKNQLPTSTGTGAITKPLRLGLRDGEVKNLQTILARDLEIYPNPQITGYFGSLTLEAVKKFQIKFGIAKAGDSGYGFVGPKTRAKLNTM